MNKEEGNKCIICGKEITHFQRYCLDPHCQQKYERQLSIIHNTKEYRLYIVLYRLAEEEALFRGDVEQY